MDDAGHEKREQQFSEMGLETGAISRETLQARANQAYRNYRAELAAGDKELALVWRNEALDYERQLKSMPTDESAPNEPGQSNTEADLDDTPTYEQLLAHYAGKRIPLGNGRYADPQTLSYEALQEIERLEAESNQIIAEDDPNAVMDDFAASGGVPPEWIAKQEQIELERELKRQAAELKRQSDQKAAELKREADKKEAKIDREARNRKRQEHAEKLRADAQAQREAVVQAKATAKAQADAAAAQAKSAEEQARIDREAEAERQLQLQRQAEADAKRQRLYADTLGKVATNASNVGAQIGNWPRPGGIGLMLFVIIVILFALVPMNHTGDTRLQLIWLALTGKVTLPTSGKTSLAAGQGSSPAQQVGSFLGNLQLPNIPSLPNLSSLAPKVPLAATSSALGSGTTDVSVPLSALPAASQEY